MAIKSKKKPGNVGPCHYPHLFRKSINDIPARPEWPPEVVVSKGASEPMRLSDKIKLFLRVLLLDYMSSVELKIHKSLVSFDTIFSFHSKITQDERRQ